MVKKFFKGILLLAVVFIALVFCKIQFIGKHFDPAAFKSYILRSSPSHSIKLTYLGTSCFIVDYKGKQYVCDPYFSNPNLLSTAFGKIPYPNLSKYIDSSLYQNVKMITVSHGHYDHCLDIGNFLKDGSNTTIATDPSILNELDELFRGKNIRTVSTAKSNWVYSSDSSFRVYKLSSVHSPHFANVTLFKGCYDKQLPALPGKLWDWKLCACNSYVVDILEGDSVYYRILMACGNMDTNGFKDLERLSQERNTDLLLHIFWKNKECKANLEHCYAVAHPKLVILHHWNNFFRSADKPVQYLRSCEFPGSIDELHQEGIMGKIMVPFTSVDL